MIQLAPLPGHQQGQGKRKESWNWFRLKLPFSAPINSPSPVCHFPPQTATSALSEMNSRS